MRIKNRAKRIEPFTVSGLNKSVLSKAGNVFIIWLSRMLNSKPNGFICFSSLGRDMCALPGSKESKETIDHRGACVIFLFSSGHQSPETGSCIRKLLDSFTPGPSALKRFPCSLEAVWFQSDNSKARFSFQEAAGR